MIPTTKLIKPIAITDAMLSSSTIAEPDTTAGEVAWAAGTAYKVGDIVIRAGTHRKYKCVVAHTSTAASPPENLTASTVATPTWLDFGPTNRWAVFDGKIGTVTTTSGAVYSMTYVLRPGIVSGLAIFECIGARQVQVTMRNGPGGPIVYQKSVNMDASGITSFYDWFLGDYVAKADFVLTDLPAQYTNPELTIVVTSTKSIVSAGVIAVGKVIQVGNAQYGAEAAIDDYSVKTPDDYGNFDVEPRDYSKANTFQILIKRQDFQRLYRVFASLRATALVIIGVDAVGYEPLTSYGFIKSCSIVVPYPNDYLCNLETEGLN